jgi:serine/threonine protein kinase/tetratricopeptide (TPR) repeat protein
MNRLLHYDIVATLGRGGMGEVYRARDTRLNRDVALKVLVPELAQDPRSLQRFWTEAQAVAATNHPNIVTIYSVEQDGDVHFITMELVAGRPLDRLIPAGGFPLEPLLDIALPIAEGLSAAHERGITHRDLKPANVMVGDDGRVRILDFGLAKLGERRCDEAGQTRTAPLTIEGSVVGTAPYMSPEQLEGRPLDQRTDIFSLGVMLYEMATGRRPFQGNTRPVLMSSILRDAPPQIAAVRADLPEHLGRVVHRCLEKDPRRRYQSASDVAYELGGLRSEHNARRTSSRIETAARTEQSIAVLPFLNRSANPDDEYFSDGLSEELINALSKISGIRVTARSSAFQFRGQELDVREVGQKLGVEAVLEGTVRIVGARLRITAELVNCADGYQIWSERFDGEMKDVFETQDEIVQAIVKQLKIELGSKADVPLVKRETGNLDAYHLVLRARHHMADFWEPGLVKAIDYLERAIELDPHYAQAHAEISFCYVIRSIFGTMTGQEAFPKVRAHALRAIELDSDLGDAHAIYGLYLAWHDFDWSRAETELRLAVTLGPQRVWTHFYFGAMLATARRGDEILPFVEKMRELDPLNRVINSHFALLLFYAGRGTEAIAAANTSLELFPDFWFLHYELAFCHWQRRDEQAAIASMQKAIDMTGERIPFLSHFLAAMCFHFGRPEEGERVLARVEKIAEKFPVSAIGRVVVDVVRGYTAAAIVHLERGRAEHDTLLCWTRAFCEQQGIIQDQAIRDAMARVGLP